MTLRDARKAYDLWQCGKEIVTTDSDIESCSSSSELISRSESCFTILSELENSSHETDATALAALKLRDIRPICKRLGLKTTGTKKELLDRIEELQMMNQTRSDLPISDNINVQHGEQQYTAN
jgi:hypothetical protein